MKNMAIATKLIITMAIISVTILMPVETRAYPDNRTFISGQDSPISPSRGDLPVSRQDILDLARLVHGEARGESFSGQVAVAAVVLNRLASREFGATIREVIFKQGAFTAVSDGQFNLTPDDSAYEAVEAALSGWDPSGGALYYWNPTTATNKWVWSRIIIKQIGQHVFAR